jgi:hypothetical protein
MKSNLSGYWLVGYLMTLSVFETIKRRMIGMISECGTAGGMIIGKGNLSTLK